MSRGGGGRGVDQKGRSKKDASHVRLYRFEQDTLAYQSLCVGARSLLFEVRSLYNGDINTNGKLFLSVRDAADRLNAGKSAISDWFADLIDRGWIRPKVEAGFNWKTAARARKATCWVLTNEATPDAAPTRDYQHWRPTDGSKRVPEKIRRSADGYSLSANGYSLSPMPDSTPKSVPDTGQFCPRAPKKAAQLSAIGNTDRYQGEAVGKPRGAEPPHSEAQRHAAGAPQRIHLACQTDTPGAAAAGPCRDEIPPASPESPSKVVKITRGKISAANRA